MSKQKEAYLFDLIKRMDASEKRNFKIYSKRNSNSKELLFVQLFDVLDKSEAYDDEKIFKSIPKLKREQLPNLKVNLYQQLLTCLRLLHRKNIEVIKIREQVDYAEVLYSKGMYRASLDIIDKAKKKAIEIQRDTLALGILDFEKLIESQHITGSMSPKAVALNEQSDALVANLNITRRLSNLSLLLYGLFLEKGYVKSYRGYERLRDYFHENLPDFNEHELQSLQRVYLYQSYVWFYNLVQDFPNSYKYSVKWVEEYYADPTLIRWKKILYLKGIHAKLNALFMLGRLDRFMPVYQELLDFNENQELSINVRSQWKMYSFVHGINRFFLNGEYAEGIIFIGEINEYLQHGKHDWDIEKLTTLNYKMACIYFGDERYDQTLDFVNAIINKVYSSLMEDIQCFARILSLICHWELGNEELVTYQVKSVYRFLMKMRSLQAVQLEIMRFLRKTPLMARSEITQEFIILKAKLEIIAEQPFERRAMLYFDILSWLETKITNQSFSEVVKKKTRKNG